MKNVPRWILVSLLHPAYSIFALTLGSLLPQSSGFAYALVLSGFLVNLPGIFITKMLFIVSFSERAFLLPCRILFTWSFVVLPLCFLVSLFFRKPDKF